MQLNVLAVILSITYALEPVAYVYYSGIGAGYGAPLLKAESQRALGKEEEYIDYTVSQSFYFFI